MKFKARTSPDRKLEVNWERVNLYLSKWRPGTYLDVEITRRQKHRSDPLRRYYWAVVLPAIAEFAGYEKTEYDQLHKFLKARYFGIKRDKWGLYRDVPPMFRDDSETTVKQKKDFVDHVVREAAKLGIYIEDPQ